jgi:hypothetical protein
MSWPTAAQIDVRSDVSNRGKSGNVSNRTNPAFVTHIGHSATARCAVRRGRQALASDHGETGGGGERIIVQSGQAVHPGRKIMRCWNFFPGRSFVPNS